MGFIQRTRCRSCGNPSRTRSGRNPFRTRTPAVRARRASDCCQAFQRLEPGPCPSCTPAVLARRASDCCARIVYGVYSTHTVPLVRESVSHALRPESFPAPPPQPISHQPECADCEGWRVNRPRPAAGTQCRRHGLTLAERETMGSPLSAVGTPESGAAARARIRLARPPARILSRTRTPAVLARRASDCCQAFQRLEPAPCPPAPRPSSPGGRTIVADKRPTRSAHCLLLLNQCAPFTPRSMVDVLGS